MDIITLQSTPPGNYSVELWVTYGGETIKYPEVNIEVLKFPVAVSVSFKDNRIKAGGHNVLIVSVKNIGNEVLNDLEIAVDYPGGFTTNVTKNIYLPEIAPYMEIKQDFLFMAPASANGDYHIGASVEFKDQQGEKHTIQNFALLKVEGAMDLSWLEIMLTIIIIILLGLIISGKAK